MSFLDSDRSHTLHRRPTLLEHRLLGHIRSPNGGSSCWERTQRRRGAWRHLFTIGLDYRIGFEVADGGRLQIAIPPGDMRSGRFDRVWRHLRQWLAPRVDELVERVLRRRR